MNNLTFGDNSFGYYETIGGGCGAGPTWNGTSGIQCHMTNTRITDPEIFEQRYPVLAILQFVSLEYFELVIEWMPELLFSVMCNIDCKKALIKEMSFREWASKHCGTKKLGESANKHSLNDNHCNSNRCFFTLLG